MERNSASRMFSAMLKPVRIAFVAAIVLSLLQLWDTLSTHSSILGALIYGAAAAGLCERNVWCAFGPALLLAAQLWSVLVIGIADWTP